MFYLLCFLLHLKFLDLFLVVAYIFRYSFPLLYTSHRLTSFHMREVRAGGGGSVTLAACLGLHPELVGHAGRRQPLYCNCGNIQVVDGSWFIS